MVIGLNGKVLETTQPAGPEFFTYNLYKSLFAAQSQHKYIVFYSNLKENSLLSEIKKSFTSVDFVKAPKVISWTHIGLPRILKTTKPDFYFSPEHTLPIFLPRSIRGVIMIHGLEMVSNKQIKKWNPRFWLQWSLIRYAIRKAILVVVPSEYTKEQIITNNLITNPEKIKILAEGVSDEFRTKYSPSEAEKIKNKYQLNKDYLIFVSTLQPRKNVIGLIKAYAKARENNQEVKNVNLVLVGKKGWNYEEIFEIINSLKLQDDVNYLNWVPQSDLPILLSSAKGFVNFSFEEGFSLTLAQSMAASIPCAVSDIPTHKALGGNTILYADPNSIEEMSKTLIQILQSDTRDQVIKARDRVSELTWENTARGFIKLLEMHN